jgi:hypothetical protein
VSSETYPRPDLTRPSDHLIRPDRARDLPSGHELISEWRVLDVPEAKALRAWRCWRIVEGRLAALVDAHGFWQEGPMQAECRRTSEHPRSTAPSGHSAPDPACTCGISGYADRLKAETTLELLGAWRPLVLGAVVLWGNVFIRGGVYRAEFGQIVVDMLSLPSPPPSSLSDGCQRTTGDGNDGGLGIGHGVEQRPEVRPLRKRDCTASAVPLQPGCNPRQLAEQGCVVSVTRLTQVACGC